MPESVLCGLIGTGIGKSLTPAMHEKEGVEQGLNYLYRIIDLDRRGLTVEDLPRLVATAADLGFRGLNITHPCKQRVIGCLDELSDDAARLGAVNTVVFADGRAVGHNTDWSGFDRNFGRGLPGADLADVVQLGAGGAGAAVAYAMARRGAATLTLVDADPVRAQQLRDSLAAMFPDVEILSAGLDRLGAVLETATGLVHATPIGMVEHPGSAVPEHLLDPRMWVAEVVYRPAETELLSAAARVGCRTLSGTGMAVFQAADAFEIFTGRTADADRMIAHMSSLIELEDRLAANAVAGALA
ncbi:shikimate dehydrogenase [Rhodococcoides fascians A21d2]|uniref:shikimate dehydrogenase n=1 Tax=Rhodococcoides fascians TaxID=1828 RepID=UPI000567F22E|nr:shikimate dehydrogenase [Rhodococcus fascians]QII01799.1 shikimate dehydrogenase [Rhodococcus fascians A21d2]